LEIAKGQPKGKESFEVSNQNISKAREGG